MLNPNILKYKNEIGTFYSFKTDSAFHECLYKGNVWDKEIIESVLEYIPYKGTILDIGSHIGSHSIFYSKKRPMCKIHAFEPQTEIRNLLELNIVENNLSNIIVNNFGIGHTERDVHMANDFKSDGYPSNIKVNYTSNDGVNFGGLGITNDPSGEKILIKTIDSQKLDDVRYIKIDVEGAEDLVVYGGRETIKKYHPVLFIEQSDKNLKHLYINDNKDLEKFNTTTFLLNLGYKRTYLGKENYLYVYEDSELNKFNKVIIWGFPLHTHTHSYIHAGWVKAFKSLGYETHWFHNDDYPIDFDYSNTLFISEGYVDDKIPINDSSIYFIHICTKPEMYIGKVKRLIEIRYLVNEIIDYNYSYKLDKSECIKLSDSTYYQKLYNNGGLRKYCSNPIPMEYECIYTCWATDLLPEEINFDNMYNKRENKIYWFGSYNERNCQELRLFMEEAKKNNIEIVYNDPWYNPKSFEEVEQYTKKSILSPDIRSSGDPNKIMIGEIGTCHKFIGYIPCRILKAISYGHLGITNSKAVYNLLDKKVIYNNNESQLFHDSMKEINNYELIKQQMEIVKNKHTFVNRIQDLLNCLNL